MPKAENVKQHVCFKALRLTPVIQVIFAGNLGYPKWLSTKCRARNWTGRQNISGFGAQSLNFADTGHNSVNGVNSAYIC